MAQKNYVAKVSPRNKEYVQRIRDLIKKYSIFGIVDVAGLPAPQFQRIRASLKGKAEVLIVKKNLIEIVFNELEKTHKDISLMKKKFNGIIGLVFTNDNPFVLYKFVKKNKSSAPAKAGSVAPKDIIVPAGPTSFAPGPIIGELGALKIKAGINAGKVEIKEDSPVAKEGDVISAKLAGVLLRLGIEPMEVGLNIKAVYEGGIIFDRKVLDVDEDAILNNLKSCASNAFRFTIGMKYYTKENVSYFIGEGSRDSLGLGVGIAYPAAETIKKLVLKASGQMAGVANTLPSELRPAGVETSVAIPVAEAQSSASVNEESKKENEKPADAASALGGFF